MSIVFRLAPNMKTIYAGQVSAPTSPPPHAAHQAADETPAETVERCLPALLQSAHQAWPGISVPPGAFKTYLVERLPVGADPQGALTELRADDLYLACACAQGIPGALAALEREVFPRLAVHIRRIDSSPGFLDDVLQLLREKLLVAASGAALRMTEYAGRSALETWVRTVALRLALDLRASSRRDGAREQPASLSQAVGHDPELEYLRTHFQREFRQAFQHALAALSVEERNLLRLHLVERLDIERIAVLFDLTPSSVYRRLAIARNAIARRTRRFLQENLDLSPDELDSLVKLVRSQLDHIVTSVLQQDPDRS